MKPWFKLTAVVCTLFAAMGCQLLNPGPRSAACEGEVLCTIYLGSYVGEGRSLKPGETLFVRGECEQTGGYAIRVINFAGQKVANPSFNYTQWETEFTYDFLTTFDIDEAGEAELTGYAIDACGRRNLLDSIVVPLSDGSDLLDESAE